MLPHQQTQKKRIKELFFFVFSQNTVQDFDVIEEFSETDAPQHILTNGNPKFLTHEVLRIKSTLNPKNLKMVNFKSLDSNNECKYECPVCLRYFNEILTSQCCGNYICYICCLQYEKIHFYNKKLFNGCHFCCQMNPIFNDVNKQAKIKTYSEE